MRIDLEIQVWGRDRDTYQEGLYGLLARALAEYKRMLGYDPLTRLYDTSIGRECYVLLRHVLREMCPELYADQPAGHLELRSHFRACVGAFLLAKLVLDNQASSEMRDAYFSEDLGL